MSNQITRFGKPTLPVMVCPDASDSSGLWWAIDRTERPHADVGRPKEFRPEVQQEAKRRLDEIAPLCFAAGAGLVTLWATPLMAGLSKDTSPDAAVARMALVVLALQDLADGAFTQAAQAHVAKTARFTPMPADLYDALVGHSNQLRQRQATLRYIVEAKTDGQA